MEQTSGYRIDNVFLTEAKFWRQSEIDFAKMEVQQSNHVSKVPITANEAGRFAIPLSVSLIGTVEGNEVFKAECQMVGVFFKIGESALTIERFCQVNGPAIIYPFIREQLASLTLKGGLGNFLLQPINFLPSPAHSSSD